MKAAHTKERRARSYSSHDQRQGAAALPLASTARQKHPLFVIGTSNVDAGRDEIDLAYIGVIGSRVVAALCARCHSWERDLFECEWTRAL